MERRSPTNVVVTWLVMHALTGVDVGAMCNVIPAATTDFRSAVGSTNRPFAMPGDLIEIRVGPACSTAVPTNAQCSSRSVQPVEHGDYSWLHSFRR